VPNSEVLAVEVTATSVRTAKIAQLTDTHLFITQLTSNIDTHYTPGWPRSVTLNLASMRNTPDGNLLQAGLCSLKAGKGEPMNRRDNIDKLSIYIPQKRLVEKPIERLMKLSEKRDRSVNYLVVEAILEYIKREENSN
jgi:hypothetical protein